MSTHQVLVHVVAQGSGHDHEQHGAKGQQLPGHLPPIGGGDLCNKDAAAKEQISWLVHTGDRRTQELLKRAGAILMRQGNGAASVCLLDWIKTHLRALLADELSAELDRQQEGQAADTEDQRILVRLQHSHRAQAKFNIISLRSGTSRRGKLILARQELGGNLNLPQTCRSSINTQPDVPGPGSSLHTRSLGIGSRTWAPVQQKSRAGPDQGLDPRNGRVMHRSICAGLSWLQWVKND